jgi:NAD(P)H dehydrogenase (quinone)
MSNILIVHAHHEPRSFSSSMAKVAAETFTKQGHDIVFSDLYAMAFQPVSDRRNFITTLDKDYLKQQREEAHATEDQGFAPEIEAEIHKLERCDLLIFSFPLWWFGMPAILKGWVDRVFAYKRIYSRGRWYENGVGKGKRAIVLMTTGSPATAYGPSGLQPTLETILTPIHKGVFWFNGFSPLPPFVAWSAAHGTDADRHAMLKALRTRMNGVWTEPVIEIPHAADFEPDTFVDTIPRFMVTIRRTRTPDAAYVAQVPAEVAYLQTLRRTGKLLSLQVTGGQTAAKDWRCFLLIRERSADAVQALCQSLPLASYLDFEIAQLDLEHAM